MIAAIYKHVVLLIARPSCTGSGNFETVGFILCYYGLKLFLFWLRCYYVCIGFKRDVLYYSLDESVSISSYGRRYHQFCLLESTFAMSGALAWQVTIS